MRDLTKIRDAYGKWRESAGFSLIELLIVVAIILIIAAIAIPNLVRSRMAANEASAVENLRTITTASVVYNTTWGNGYPPALATLGGPPSPTATCDQAQLVNELITSPPNQQSGYTFAYTGQGAPGAAPPGCSQPGFSGYLATATPMTEGTSGQRAFCSDTPGVIHFDPAGTPPTTVSECDALQTLQ